jgi:predicted short-subunit dehydrogenase-like oxidoreductase (DUF2520 family)
VHIIVVGPGRVGTTLALTHQRRGDAVTLVGPPGKSLPEELANAGLALVSGPVQPAKDAVLLFCLPDDQLAQVCQQWADFLGKIQNPLRLVAHTSGLHDLQVLNSFRQQGSTRCIAALHPILAFASPHQAQNDLSKAAVTAIWQGAEQNARVLVDCWQARFTPMPNDADRRLYHLALCLAANHVTALIAEAEQLLKPALGAQAADLLLDLAQGALSNARRLGTAQALTGPVVRGDLVALQAHVKALPDDVSKERYRQALLSVLSLADRSGRLSSTRSQALHDWLNPNS